MGVLEESVHTVESAEDVDFVGLPELGFGAGLDRVEVGGVGGVRDEDVDWAAGEGVRGGEGGGDGGLGGDVGDEGCDFCFRVLGGDGVCRGAER